MKVNSITIKQNEVKNKNIYFMYTPTLMPGLIPQNIFIKHSYQNYTKTFQDFI